MTESDVLWTVTDSDGDTARLQTGPSLEGDPRPGRVAHLVVNDQGSVDLDDAAVRDLRGALNRLLDGHTATAATETAVTLHVAQHLQLDAAARRISRGVVEQTDILARIAAEPDLNVPAMVGTMLGVQRHTVAALADLLSAIAGAP